MKIGIVGAGINGTYLAWKLSKEHDVTLFEKKKKIGYPNNRSQMLMAGESPAIFL